MGLNEMKSDFIKVKEKLKNQITFGSYQMNDKLPTETELMADFNVSRYAVRKALTELQNEHFIYKVQGSGMYVEEWNKKWNLNTESKTIGLICTHIADYIFPKVISQIDAVIGTENYSLLLANTHNDPEKERLSLIKMLDSQVAGLIIEPSESAKPNRNLDIYQQITKKNIPLLFINAKYPELDAPGILNDDTEAEKKMVNYLLEMGHRKILGIFQVDDRQGVHRMSGFMQAYQEMSIDLSDSNIIMYSSHDPFGVISKKIDFYLNSDACPTAIACYNDELAIEVLAKLKGQGLSIPQDISLVGFDNFDSSAYLSPGLTTMNYQRTRVGQEAGEGILSLLKGQEVKTIIHHPKLQLRNSVRKIN